MKPYRLIAIDLDGTLLCPKGTVTARAKAAVHRALSSGYVICFATGRNYTECRSILRDVAHYDHFVFSGGAIVMDTVNSVTVQSSLMNPDLARELCGMFESFGHAAIALQDGSNIDAPEYFITAGVPLNEATLQWEKVTESRYHAAETASLAKYHHRNTIRVGVVASKEEIEHLKKILNEQFAGRAIYHSLYVPSYQVEVLECFQPGVDKWQGILHVAKRHNIRPEQIVAIGDDVNDLPMIKSAGLGVAMGNAHPEVMKIAKRTIKANHEEGLAQFLEELAAQDARPISAPGEAAA